MPRLLERVLIVVAALAIAVGVIALLSGGLLAGNDSPGVSGADAGPGVQYQDQGHATLRSGEARPAYDSNPPTSGPHAAAPTARDGSDMTDDELLQALQEGDVVLMYGTRKPPPGLAAVADSVAPPFSPALAASGNAVILAHRPGIEGIVALAWTHMLRSDSADDPALRTFAEDWLGRGAPARGGSTLPGQ
jgi:Protein of unknown function (DUF3105)